MKEGKRYHDLVKMYHFNPIQDCSLFENMETQYFYFKEEETDDETFMGKLIGLFNSKDKYGYHRRKGIHQYVYWYKVDYEEYQNRKQMKYSNE